MLTEGKTMLEYHEKIRKLLIKGSARTVSPILGRITDRELALLLYLFTPQDREAVLAKSPRKKAERVREELTVLKQRRFDQDVYLHAAKNIIKAFRGTKTKPFKS